MRPIVALILAVASAVSTASSAGPLIVGGDALVREDPLRRIVAVLDVDRDGRADHVFLLDPVEPLARPLATFEGRADVALEDQTFRLDAADGSLRLRLGVRARPEGIPANEIASDVLVMYGRAIQHRTYSGGPALRDVDTSGIVTVDAADCGESDADCDSGGRLSGACSVTCLAGGAHGASFGVVFSAQTCSTTCLPGAYGCCSCKAMRQTPECKCRSVGALKPCEEQPPSPQLPLGAPVE